MANTTVITTIVVRFDDQFTAQAKQASEKSKKSLEEVLKTGKETENIFKSISRQQVEAIKLNEKLAPGAKEKIDKYMAGLEDGFLEKSSFEKIESVGSLTLFAIALKELTAAVAIFYSTWKIGQTLEEWRVGGKPVEEYVGGVKESLEQLGNSESIGLPPVPEETVRSLEITKSCLEQIQQMQDIFIIVNLVDNVTQEAKRLRQEIEAIFSKDITQRIKVVQETVGLKSSFGSSGSDSIFSDSPLELQTSSVDLTGFGPSVSTSTNITVPGFASGIDRVPRDMLAMIHKDEAVLPKNRAEDFRRGRSSGLTVQKLEFSINAPNLLNLDRETVGELAFMLRDELKRLDERMN